MSIGGWIESELVQIPTGNELTSYKSMMPGDKAVNGTPRIGTIYISPLQLSISPPEIDLDIIYFLGEPVLNG